MSAKAIIIGATSGIGKALATHMAKQGYKLGLTGRREHLLHSLQQQLGTQTCISVMDIAQPHNAIAQLKQLIEQMQGVDIIIINAGTGSCEPDFPLSGELETIAVNVTGFTCIANAAYHYFTQQGAGHIVATSSIMSLRGGPCASYNASKAYIASYLEGLYCRAYRDGIDISVTDIRPGFVDTEMAKGNGIFWLAPVDKAAQQILSAIEKKKRIAYVTKRWQLIALLMRFMPFKGFVRLMLGARQ
ncbi:SDR family NAD(P)-dependent oxidoreductase [Pseudoalteromonas sp. Of7M-16]|uniref:SDR family NAD(P)-dependent oxidoreductase n=1 Tax=Pseudoalteromonas sp. Of7M-16 TaxID=2917756 RepID=UPI001EF5DE87|nr:SDR family NAD(P)-dependent oxidoreductase [Pseudoalteromonas sp. Of7M-16]MCG7548098.1 SDR family NAD(P)-dependent oxidoreductase [Pseudoalteromonas sp. Of7M-16]